MLRLQTFQRNKWLEIFHFSRNSHHSNGQSALRARLFRMQSIYESNVDPLRPNDAHGISLQLIGRNKRVLELGAASGHVTRALKSLDNSVTAVERDGRFEQTLAEIADAVLITDLDWLDLRQKLQNEKFDVVLAGDVLEHCRQPELVLLQLHDLLNPDGYVVISLPNIAHGDVRLALLTGRFEYRPTGLLDSTHIRFFTRDTITTFLNQNEFDVAEIFASTAPIGTTEFGQPHPSVPREAITFVQHDRDAQVYQYIVKAMPRALRNSSVDNKLSNAIHAEENLLAKLSLFEEYVGRMTFSAAPSAHAELESARAELESARAELESARAERRQLQIQILEAKDYAIGASAELGVMRFRYQESQRLVDSLVHQLNLLHGSRTWKIGRFVLLPLRAVRKLARMILR
jgi:2-polyprenyl-3-methyl-5-hydroxy-6-metoxy-1,4-benzoquinol methylase